MTASLHFSSGKCVEARFKPLASESMNEFFRSVTASYIGKSPEEIAGHARAWSESVKDWPAPRDAVFGWALTQSLIRMALDQFASEAEAAGMEILNDAKLENVA